MQQPVEILIKIALEMDLPDILRFVGRLVNTT